MMIGYIISSQDMSVADMENAVYASYEEPIVLDKNGEYIIYVMIVDGGMNIRYLRSDRIIIDKTAPVINGIEDGRIYCSGQTFTVTEEYLYGVFVNNEEIKPENGVYTLPFGKNSIVVYDEAGNKTTADVTVYDGHTPGLNLGDCTIPVYCVYCSEVVTAAKQHDFSGDRLSDENGHWHECQNAGCEITDAAVAHAPDENGIRADAEKHWHECVCGVRLDEDAHTFEWVVDREATEDETGEKHEECSVCGTKRSEGTEIPKKEKTPSTSDPANLGIWVAAAMLSSLCLAGLIVLKKKKAF